VRTLSQYVIRPDRNVIVQQMNGRMHSVAGEVNRPNNYLRETRVFDNVNEAGGFKDFAYADSRISRIFR
jgi:protein involved in polysaccharide export with SLBB domain